MVLVETRRDLMVLLEEDRGTVGEVSDEYRVDDGPMRVGYIFN